uniref:Uncharacterized protein n=1 Tax=Anopheles funestus TaxID=62324 RepID=A0A182S4H2_ANOFN
MHGLKPNATRALPHTHTHALLRTDSVTTTHASPFSRRTKSTALFNRADIFIITDRRHLDLQWRHFSTKGTIILWRNKRTPIEFTVVSAF